jgi:hypothetical protein
MKAGPSEGYSAGLGSPDRAVLRLLSLMGSLRLQFRCKKVDPPAMTSNVDASLSSTDGPSVSFGVAMVYLMSVLLNEERPLWWGRFDRLE